MQINQSSNSYQNPNQIYFKSRIKDAYGKVVVPAIGDIYAHGNSANIKDKLKNINAMTKLLNGFADTFDVEDIDAFVNVSRGISNLKDDIPLLARNSNDPIDPKLRGPIDKKINETIRNLNDTFGFLHSKLENSINCTAVEENYFAGELSGIDNLPIKEDGFASLSREVGKYPDLDAFDEVYKRIKVKNRGNIEYTHTKTDLVKVFQEMFLPHIERLNKNVKAFSREAQKDIDLDTIKNPVEVENAEGINDFMKKMQKILLLDKKQSKPLNSASNMQELNNSTNESLFKASDGTGISDSENLMRIEEMNFNLAKEVKFIGSIMEIMRDTLFIGKLNKKQHELLDSITRISVDTTNHITDNKYIFPDVGLENAQILESLDSIFKNNMYLGKSQSIDPELDKVIQKEIALKKEHQLSQETLGSLQGKDKNIFYKNL